MIYEMEGADEEELWFDEYGTADHGAAVGGAGADVVSGYYEILCVFCGGVHRGRELSKEDAENKGNCCSG